ncbi:zinc-binding dehydrogenase [Streptococcus marimammalium]|uniref:zinc-binding dehydrogenase n=1 Tax=Streptococcus marimammalium TaxID=269666 RepID=UPI00036AF5A4|nr:zinc-binding dehydrogenase [Streptococcus marimammalium]
MLNQIYQLIKPKNLSIKYEEIDINSSHNIIVKPNFMAICHADQRYYQGRRDPKILAKKLPMAPIHEATGIVVADPTGTYEPGQKVAMIPNQPPKNIEKDNIFFENYLSESYFLSSGNDGFMQEVISLPLDRVVPYENISDEVAALSEFTSVSMHSIARFDKIAHSKRDSVVIVGDGSLAYVVATSLHYTYPDMKITVIGRNPEKLRMFNFIENTFMSNEVPESLKFDHGFECAGGQGSESAINDIIDYLNPQGTIMIMGVSENKVSINTRDVLEKGITIVGSSRSGRKDFEQAIEMISDKQIQSRLKNIIFLEEDVKTISDIHKVFATDLSTPFKTVFKWDI